MKLCECGCGQPTLPYAKTDPGRGYVKGDPRRFIQGHNLPFAPAVMSQRNVRKNEAHPRWRGDDAGYMALHAWLNRRHPRTGVCSKCGRRPQGRGTEWAFLHHPDPHTRNIDDYRELCASCHRLFDQH